MNIKIVIPTNGRDGLSDKVAEHFGRCNTYTFLDENGKLLEVIDNISEHMGGEGLPPELMKKNRANILLCKALGPRALTLCGELGIEVYCSKEQTVEEIFEKWQNNKIKKASPDDVCEEHRI